MKDELKGQNFRELISFDAFQAQVALEDDMYQSLLTRLLSLDLTRPDMKVEYAKLRGSLDTLKSLKTTRESLVLAARSRSHS